MTAPATRHAIAVDADHRNASDQQIHRTPGGLRAIQLDGRTRLFGPNLADHPQILNFTTSTDNAFTSQARLTVGDYQQDDGGLHVNVLVEGVIDQVAEPHDLIEIVLTKPLLILNKPTEDVQLETRLVLTRHAADHPGRPQGLGGDPQHRLEPERGAAHSRLRDARVRGRCRGRRTRGERVDGDADRPGDARPAERAGFVLREVFDLSYDEIAGIIRKSMVTARRIAGRARDHVAARRPRVRVGRAEQHPPPRVGHPAHEPSRQPARRWRWRRPSGRPPVCAVPSQRRSRRIMVFVSGGPRPRSTAVGDRSACGASAGSTCRCDGRHGSL